MKFLLRQVWSCLIEQMIPATFKKRSSQIRQISVSEHRTPDQVSLFRWKQCIGFHRSFLTFRWMRPQTFISIGLSVSCNYVSLPHDRCIEGSPKLTCALFIFSNSCILRICVSRRTFSFRNNSSCNLVCSRRDSTNSCCTSCNAISCTSVRFCRSSMHLLRDSTWNSLLARSVLARFNKWYPSPSSRVSLKIDTLAFPNTELHVWFLCSLRVGKTMQPVSQ